MEGRVAEAAPGALDRAARGVIAGRERTEQPGHPAGGDQIRGARQLRREPIEEEPATADEECLLEHYSFTDLQINTQLSDNDFSKQKYKMR